jgi:hypothetical protein
VNGRFFVINPAFYLRDTEYRRMRLALSDVSVPVLERLKRLTHFILILAVPGDALLWPGLVRL